MSRFFEIPVGEASCVAIVFRLCALLKGQAHFVKRCLDIQLLMGVLVINPAWILREDNDGVVFNCSSISGLLE
jgi:hypothetical protein